MRPTHLACLALLSACDDFANFEGDDLFDVVVDGSGLDDAEGRDVRLVVLAPDGAVVADRAAVVEGGAFLVEASNVLVRGLLHEVVLHVDLDADGVCGGADDVRLARVPPVETDVRLGEANFAPDPSACAALPT